MNHRTVGCVSVLLLAIFFVLPQGIRAMQSSNYAIPSDSINAGGALSESGNYATDDTLGEIATGRSESDQYALNAGFRQMQEVYISLSQGTPISLSDINGLTGGASDGQGSWTVITDDPAGYTLYIRSATSPALKGSLSDFADYAPSGANPDYEFAIDSSTSAFGFSPEGTDIVARFKDNGMACNAGTFDTPGACWDGLSTTDAPIAQSTVANHPSGTATTVKFRAQSGSAHIQENDAYAASITVTAIAL